MSDVLLVDKHVAYVKQLNEHKAELAYHYTEHLRLNGLYWGLTALALMRHAEVLPHERVIEFVLSCWREDAGAFAPHPGHDAHLHSTLSAVQVLATIDALSVLDQDDGKRERIVAFTLSLQNAETGAFAADEWREYSTRFVCTAVCTLSLLGRLDALDKGKTVGWIAQCRNFDGGFGMVPGAESHAAYVWVCISALAILDRLDVVDSDTLCWWLCERQLPNGGLNGRPEKLEDVCYSWWVIASLAILGRVHWIDGDKLSKFILSAQDPDDGGISDRAEDMADVWHTVFGIAGLSLLGYEGLAKVDPVYCMPAAVIARVLDSS